MEQEDKLYFRSNHTIKDVLTTEFAFSVIYNNIDRRRMDLALRTVEMNAVPNLLFLVQVDNYSQEALKYKLTEEFKFKFRIVQVLRNCLEKKQIDGIVGNLVGSERIAVLCHFPFESDSYESLTPMTKEICEEVYGATGFTVSVCMSGICSEIRDFSEEYEKAVRALNESFYLGRNVQLQVVSNSSREAQRETGQIFREILPGIYTSISAGKPESFRENVKKLFDYLETSNQSREEAILCLALLIDKIAEYAIQCDSRQEAHIRRLANAGQKGLRKYLYAEELAESLSDFYREIEAVIQTANGRSEAAIFREPVSQYIRDNYKDKLYLDEIALQFGYCKHHFIKTFKRVFGMNFTEYVNLYRVGIGRKLLKESTLSIEMIAEEAGFSSSNYFQIVFKKQLGMTPTEYRKKTIF